MSLSGKRIAILGGTRMSCQLVDAAKNLGMRTVVIDYNPPDLSPAKQIADEHVLLDIADTASVARYLKHNGIDGAITGYADSILAMYADICKQAGLPCYGSRELFELFVDKSKWNSLCWKHGVPAAGQHDAKLLLEGGGGRVAFPLFVKPADSSGSRGAAVVRSKEELRRAYEVALGYSKNAKVIAEEYLEGPEITVFWLFIDGEYYVMLLGDRIVKRTAKGAVPLPAGYLFPSRFTQSYLDEVAPKVRKMLASVGVRNGMMFMQCIVKDGIPHVYDIGYRLTGSLEHHILRKSAGYNPVEMLLRYAVSGNMVDADFDWAAVDKGRSAPGFNVSYLMKPGVVGSIGGLEDVRRLESVAAVVEAMVPGDVLPQDAEGQLRQIAIRALGTADSKSEIPGIMLEVQGAMSILSPSGEDLRAASLESSDFYDLV